MLKPFLLIYLILFYGVTFFWRSYHTWRQTGINPYRLNKQEGVHSFLARLYRLVSLFVAVTILIYIFADNLYVYLTPIQWLLKPTVTAVGLTLLLLSFVWILMAQRQMGRSWRIGIDAENKTELVTHGVFSVSRNPIFLGMRLNLAGFFFVLPNALTLAIWLLGDVAIQMQVFLEEEHLRRTQGIVYEHYLATTPRYLGLPKVHPKIQK